MFCKKAILVHKALIIRIKYKVRKEKLQVNFYLEFLIAVKLTAAIVH